MHTFSRFLFLNPFLDKVIWGRHLHLQDYQNQSISSCCSTQAHLGPFGVNTSAHPVAKVRVASPDAATAHADVCSHLILHSDKKACQFVIHRPPGTATFYNQMKCSSKSVEQLGLSVHSSQGCFSSFQPAFFFFSGIIKHLFSLSSNTLSCRTLCSLLLLWQKTYRKA